MPGPALKRILLLLKDVHQEGDGWAALCPAHDDSDPSLSVCEKNGKVLMKCHAGCPTQDVVAALGLRMADLFVDGDSADGLTLQEYAEAKGLPVAFLRGLGLREFRYRGRSAIRIPYLDEREREISIRHRLRLTGKRRFDWRRGAKAAPYGLWRLADARAAKRVVIVEGESDAQTLWLNDIPAVGIPGADTWREEWAGAFEGIASIYVIREPDKGGDTLIDELSHSGLRDRIRVVTLGDHKDASDLYLDGPKQFPSRFQKALDAAVSLRQAAVAAAGMEPAPSLSEVERAFSKHLLLADPHVVKVVLATAAAHLLKGDPLWMVLVAPSSGGKTEFVTPLRKVPDAVVLSSLTPQTLASGWQHGKASLLLKMGPTPLLCLKDFGSILSLKADARGEILATLREIYDGSYSKAFGNGAKVNWQGKLTLIAAATEVLDEYHSVLSVLGERFVICRMVQPDAEAAALRAQQVSGGEGSGGAQERDQLCEMVASFLAALPPTQPEGIPSRWLATLTAFTVQARTGTIRDPRDGELRALPQLEGPGRLVKQLLQLDRALRWIDPDITLEEVREIVMRIALDSIPRQRLQVLRAVAAAGEVGLATSEIAKSLRLPTTSARRVLDDLRGVKCLVSSGGGHGSEVTWVLSDEVKDRVARAKINLGGA